MFFFFFNTEKRIGFKKLSKADLGLSSTSKQTHIGLYEDILTFLDNSDVVKTAMLIYDNYCDRLTCNFDRIEKPDGTFRSSKIRKGDGNDSIVSKIREFAAVKKDVDWYLIWSGLESEELVFLLMSSDLDEFLFIQSIFPAGTKILTENSPTYSDALAYLMKKVNIVSTEIQKDLEVISQTNKLSRKYKRRDIENAELQFRETGRLGEELIEEYLKKEKGAGRVDSYVWVNKNSESGLPYDFCVNDHLYIDVKSTRYDFDQYMFFSNQEVEFVTTLAECNYSVYRVYGIKEEKQKLKICGKCLQYMAALQESIVSFQGDANQQHAILQNIKIGIQPKDCFNEIQSSIIL